MFNTQRPQTFTKIARYHRPYDGLITPINDYIEQQIKSAAEQRRIPSPEHFIKSAPTKLQQKLRQKIEELSKGLLDSPTELIRDIFCAYILKSYIRESANKSLQNAQSTFRRFSQEQIGYFFTGGVAEVHECAHLFLMKLYRQYEGSLVQERINHFETELQKRKLPSISELRAFPFFNPLLSSQNEINFNNPQQQVLSQIYLHSRLLQKQGMNIEASHFDSFAIMNVFALAVDDEVGYHRTLKLIEDSFGTWEQAIEIAKASFLESKHKKKLRCSFCIRLVDTARTLSKTAFRSCLLGEYRILLFYYSYKQKRKSRLKKPNNQNSTTKIFNTINKPITTI